MQIHHPLNPSRRKKLFNLPWIILIFFIYSGLQLHANTQAAANKWKECSACHRLDDVRLVGPGLKGVTERRTEEWLIKFIKNSQEVIQSGDPTAVALWEEYNKVPMPSYADLSDDEIRDLLAYIKAGGVLPDEVAAADEAAEKEAIDDGHQKAEPIDAEIELLQMKAKGKRQLGGIFIFIVIILLISIVDLSLTRIIKARFVHIIVILISIAIISEITFVEATSLGRQQYYQPDQPVWFSHKIHAGQNQIDCQYCHVSVEYSKNAGIPPVNVCMNCHKQVKEGSISGTEEIAKIYAAYETGKPIEWIRIHNLPDHAYFSHAQHVGVGKLDCTECHGPIEKMDEVMQVNDLGMGWCISCHREKEVQFNENEFYSMYTRLHEELHEGKRSKITVDAIGGNECQKCHY